MLNGSDVFHCLVTDLRGKPLSFTNEYDVSCGLVAHGLYYVEVVTSYFLSVESLCHKKVLNFAKCLSASIEMMRVLPPSFC